MEGKYQWIVGWVGERGCILFRMIDNKVSLRHKSVGVNSIVCDMWHWLYLGTKGPGPMVAVHIQLAKKKSAETNSALFPCWYYISNLLLFKLPFFAIIIKIQFCIGEAKNFES